MNRPRLMNRQPDLFGKVVFDGYDFGDQLQFLEGANKLLLERGGYFIRRNDHPMFRFWRLPKDKLLPELDVIFHRLMELADGRFQDTCQSICQRIEAAQSAPDRQVFTWGWSFESPHSSTAGF